jgi:hypothetical protein
MATSRSKSEVTANTCNLQAHMDVSATDGAVRSAGGVMFGRVKPKGMSTFAFNMTHSVFPLAVYWLKMRRLTL